MDRKVLSSGADGEVGRVNTRSRYTGVIRWLLARILIARSERGTRLYFYERDACTISVRRAWSPPSSLHWTLFGSAEVAPTLPSPLYPPSSKYVLPPSVLEAGLQPSSNADHWSGQSPRSSAKIFLKLVVQSYSPLYSRGSKATVRVGIIFSNPSLGILHSHDT